MLTYAYQTLKQKTYDKVAAEEFENVQDLFAAILDRGISQQLKQGLHKEYIDRHDDTTTLKGKLDFQGTIRHRLMHQQLLACEYDELSENNIFNQILKTTAIVLIRQKSVKTANKIALKKDMLMFNTVDELNPLTIPWGRLQYRRNNLTYKMLMNICYFVLNNLLISDEKGDYKVLTFTDEQMDKLFEKFVLEYYRYHYHRLKATPAEVKWDLDEGVIDFLPAMKTDITLTDGVKTLIIDTKSYMHMMQENYGKTTFYSNNMYQIFTYVKNKDSGNTGNVAGMLLYAKTKEDIVPDADFVVGGNKISVKTLDLNVEFEEIAEQLNGIADGWFGIMGS